jgi:hypothetical protein
MVSQIAVVFCIDVEPDEVTPNRDRPERWLGYERTSRLAVEWRQRFEQETGSPAQFSWFVRADPQVEQVYGSASWPFEQYQRYLSEAQLAGDEIGLHVHAGRWFGTQGRWVEDFGDPTWVEECLSVGCAAFQAGLGERCHSIRFGNHFMDQRASDCLERLGVSFDLTLEPLARKRAYLNTQQPMTGLLPDYSRIPRRAYRRSKHSFQTQDDERTSGLWILPVSTAPLGADSPADARAASDDGAYLRLGLWYPHAAFSYVLESYLCDVDPACLVMVMRSDLPLVPEFEAHIRQNLEWLWAHPLRRRLVVTRPADAVARVGGRKPRPSHFNTAPDSGATESAHSA